MVAPPAALPHTADTKRPRTNPRPSLAAEYESEAKRWNETLPEVLCLEERFGECASVQSPHIVQVRVKLDEHGKPIEAGSVTSDWAARHSLSWMLPAKPTRVPIEISDTLLSEKPLPKPADMSRLTISDFAMPPRKVAQKPDWEADKFDRYFAHAIWAIRAAHGVVLMSDDRPSMFTALDKLVPYWARIPELYVWIADHTTGAETAGGSRRTIPGMADRLREGPLSMAAIVDDGSIRCRILERAQNGSTDDHLSEVFARLTAAKPKREAPYELPDPSAVATYIETKRQQLAA